MYITSHCTDEGSLGKKSVGNDVANTYVWKKYKELYNSNWNHFLKKSQIKDIIAWRDDKEIDILVSYLSFK